MMKQRGIQRVVLMLFSLLVFFSAVFQSQNAKAHDTYFLQTMVNVSDYSYTHKVHFENRGFLQNAECSHMELKIGDFHKMLKINQGKNIHPNTLSLEEMEAEWGDEDSEDVGKCSATSGGLVGGKYLTFGFAPHQLTTALLVIRNNATRHDGDRANLVASTLVPALNTAMKFVYEEDASTDEEFFERSKSFANAVKKMHDSGSAAVNGATLTRGKEQPYEGGVDKKTGLANDDWVTIEKNGAKAEFPYQMLKGYSTDGGKGFDNSKLGGVYSSFWHDGEYKKDASHMTWNLLMYQANFSYFVHGIDSTNNDAVGGTSMLENHIVKLLQNLLLGLTSILGLESMGDLVFNEGNRGLSTYYGAFNSQWESLIMTYHWIFQSIAWSLILFAFFKLLLMRNVSLMNPQMRVSLKEGAMDLIITGATLVFAFPVINFLLSINHSLVGVFASIGVDLNDLASINNYDGTISGVLMQLYYFFINIWVNFVYIVRGITIAILVVMSPLFIASIAFGGKWKGMFSNFVRELAGNIFMQSFHAFVVSFLFAATTGTRGIETAVTFFALIVLTEYFRSLVFGDAGGLAGKVGMGSIAAGAGLAAGALRKDRSSSRTRDKNGTSKNSSSGASSSSGSSTHASGESEAFTSNVKTMDTSNLNAESGSFDENGAVVSKDVGGTLDTYTRGSVSGESHGKGGIGSFSSNSAMQSANPLGGVKSGQTGNYKKAGSNLGKLGIAGAGMAVGASYTMAYGGTSPMAGGVGGAVMGASARKGAEVFSKEGKGDGGKGNLNTQGDWKQTMNQSPGFLAFQGKDDGTMEVHEDAASLSEMGILRAYSNDDEGVSYVYDVDKMEENEAENISNVYDLYQNGTDEDRAVLSEQGISGASKNKDGNVVVSYNQQGMEKLGITGARTNGGKFVRTVSENQQSAPRHSFPVQGKWQQQLSNDETVVSVKSMGNNKTEVKQDLHALSERGIVSARSENVNHSSENSSSGTGGKPTSTVSYNTAKLDKKNHDNVKKINDLYTNGSDADRTALKEQGIDSVSTDDQGHVNIKYNSAGMGQLGVESFEAKDGELTTVIDSKQDTSPTHSFETFNATEYEKIKETTNKEQPTSIEDTNSREDESRE